MKQVKEWDRTIIKLADKYYSWGGNHTEEEFMNDIETLGKLNYLKGFRAGIEATKNKPNTFSKKAWNRLTKTQNLENMTGGGIGRRKTILSNPLPRRGVEEKNGILQGANPYPVTERQTYAQARKD